jgi:preprotein translocase subunit Sec63
LTNAVKFDNWQKYGDPDGSKAYKAIEVALPSFLLKPENQTSVLLVFFLGFICLPIGILFKK